MDIKDVKKEKERKTRAVRINTYPSLIDWVKENNLSITAIFENAVMELMRKHKNKIKTD